MKKHLLISFAALSCAASLCPSCSDYDKTLLDNCERTSINVIYNNQYVPLKMLSATLVRQPGAKVLSQEAYFGDTVKLLLKVTDTAWAAGGGQGHDSLTIGTYRYVRNSKDTLGRVIAGFRQGTQLQWLPTDSSTITISAVDVKRRTVTGRYYLRTVSPAMVISGEFSEVCLLSIP